ncbi:MAG: hypothetical protein IPJ65_07575 [Archangiaceae bacterium]|nr:hypothetical protein [Archangiaceae bacterium]
MNRTLVVSLPLFVLALSCGGGAKNMCTAKNIRCDNTLICDPDDGVCKCGGHSGVICPSNFLCDAATNTCQSTRCAGVDCSSKPSTSCDVFDGMCKCGGTGGTVCAANETCDPAGKKCVPAVNCNEKACSQNQTCDLATGQCKCGSNSCMPDEFCSPASETKMCVANICNGVHCAGANTCDTNDGYCKCNGAICQSGEACSCPAGSDGGTCADSARVCKPGSACVGVSCGNGTTCDPVDGKCKCGGPGGPTCAANQICALGPPPQCQGGAQCVNLDGSPKLCSGGTSCDTEDGKCKCGGRGGTVCSPADAGVTAEVCIATALQQVCRRACDIRFPDCPMGTQCFYDSSAATPQAYCAVPTGTQAEDSACQQPTQCFAGTPARALHCNGLALGQTGLCRPYCDTAVPNNAGCLQTPRPQTCTQIAGAPSGFGFCLAQ